MNQNSKDMKRHYFITYMIIMMAILSACYSDNSEEASVEVGNISISGIKEKYSAMSDNGEVLQINPVIKSDYPKKYLEYHWFLYEKSKENAFTDNDGNHYEEVLISEDENLSYPVNLGVGDYTIVLRVKSLSNGCVAYQRTSLNVSTRYTEGFYILKEVNGNTELDFLSPSNEKIDNVFTRLHQAPVSGKPKSLSVVYNHAYIAPETNKASYDHSLCVITDDRKVRFLRAPDLAVVHDEKTMFYASDGIDEVPYTSVNTTFKNLYLSSRGAYITACGDATAKPMPIGKFSHPEEPAGASPFVVKTGTYETVFWNEKNHTIYRIDMNGGIKTPSPKKNAYQEVAVENLTNYECVSAGQTYINYDTKLFFLFNETSTGNKIFYRMTANWSNCTPDTMLTVNPDMHFAKATYRSYNARWASIAYCVDGGKLYAYSLNYQQDPKKSIEEIEKEAEWELKPKGIPAGEEIVYAETIYWEQFNQDRYGDSFRYLAIGTQRGDSYQLYLYNMLGGSPDGAPVKTISGTGKLKRAVYLAPKYPGNDSGPFMGYPY